ncbi:MAG: glutamine-hydrolyzing GMP synthase [Thermoanaerobacteraceae bacterium]|nr:glutamine-hydrolyzing GMP synthase [Thermoanaerobacteraceae bacterium]
MRAEKVLILNFGGQYTQLIARRIRECNVYCEILNCRTSADEIKEMKPTAIVLSGGPASVYVKDAPLCDKGIFELGVPVLGICYGAQLMAQLMGGKVSMAQVREYGRVDLTVDNTIPLFRGIDRVTTAWMSHTDSITILPEGFKVIGSTPNCPVAAMGNIDKKLYAVQFHPEVEHTVKGMDIIRNFLFIISGLKADWTMESLVEQTVKSIREEVGDREAICAISGGVDSTVAAVLVHRAIGDQLHCILVDNGLLRLNEAEDVERLLKEEFDMDIKKVDAQELFMSALKGVTEPEQKRKLIGNTFIKVFDREAKEFNKAEFLVQGTLYPDVIESGDEMASTIKSHHNVGGLPEDMHFKLIEPLRLLFKDEVRQVGKELGIPDEILKRQPFPGPGLAIRILGEVTEQKLDILRRADYIVTREIKKAGLYNELWQSFAILPDIHSVGVMGDERTYGETIVLRAVTSSDGMTADWARLPYDVLDRISRQIINEVYEVNRVVYDITSKPPATIEWE